jgi:hypothetical protein
MGDPRQTFHLPVEGEPPVRFTMTALQKAERTTQKTVPQIGAFLFTGAFGVDLLIRVAWAGLEGARLKERTGGREWKLSQVEELADEAFDNGVKFDEFAAPVVDAFKAACDRLGLTEPDEEPPEDPPTAAGTGTSSVEPPSESA